MMVIVLFECHRHSPASRLSFFSVVADLSYRFLVARRAAPRGPRLHSAQSSALFLLFHCTALAVAAVLDHRFAAGAYAANPTGGANRIAPLVMAVPPLEEGVGVEGVGDAEVDAAAAAVAR